jgi:predicted amidohydrolase YtcJ
MPKPARSLTRRDFLKCAAGGAGGLILSGLGSGTGSSLATPWDPGSTGGALQLLAAAQAPNLILVNGRVMTIDATNSVAQAVAIRGDRILQTGTNEAIRALAGPDTRILDLRGRTTTPGFVDAHCHTTALGLVGAPYVDINPPAVTTIAQVQERIADDCRRVGPDKWVIAQGYLTYDGEYPDKTMLDPVSPHNPVMMMNQGGHMGAVNTYALNLAGVTADTPDPMFGLILRDEQGEPTGALVNHAAMDIFRILWADEVLTPELRYNSVLRPQDDFASFGITSYGDVNVRGLSAVQSYFDAARNGAHTIRGYVLNTIEYFPELDGRTEDIDAIRYEDDFLTFGGYKFLVDGALMAAYTHQPHSGTVWNKATWNEIPLKFATGALHNKGYQCAFHCIGDAAVDMALDAIEHAMTQHPRADPRHRIEHAILNTNSALDRARDLGVVISTQPHGIPFAGEELVEIWGEQRAMRIVPTRSWLDRGVHLSISSDCPTMPWWQPPIVMTAAVTRLSSASRVFDASQCLTMDEVMRAYTMGGAYACFQEDVKGSLEPGKFADVVVWRLDPYVTPLAEMMSSHPVDMTFIGGKLVFERVKNLFVPAVVRNRS